MTRPKNRTLKITACQHEVKVKSSGLPQGFTKRGAKEFIHMHANASLGKMTQYAPLENEARVAAHWRWMKGLTERELLDVMVPVLESADRYDILVVGSDRAKTAVMPSGPSSVTVGVDQFRP